MRADDNQVVAVFYSIDGHASRGRLRPESEGGVFPTWLEDGTAGKLQLHDGSVLDVVITLVKLRSNDWKDDDHFAEFVVRPVRH